MFETSSGGFTNRISVASEYNGTDTKWTEMWRRVPGFADAVAPNIARAFNPPMCVEYSSLYKYVRIEMDAVLDAAGYPEVDAIQVRGTQDMSYAYVTGGNVVEYFIGAGLHALDDSAPLDSFGYTASDCQAESRAATVYVYVTSPLVEDAATLTQYATLPVTFVPQTTSVVDFSVLALPGGATANNTLVAMTAPFDVYELGANGELGAAIPVGASCRGSLLALVAGSSTHAGAVYLWSAVGNVVYRRALTATPVCPTATAFSVAVEDCQPCAAFSLEYISALAPLDLFLFRSTCPICNPGSRRATLPETLGAGHAACEPCATATYRPATVTDGACLPCPVGSITAPDRSSAIECPRDEFSWDPSNASCDRCPSNGYCPGGTALAAVGGYWRATVRSTVMQRCVYVGACDYDRRDASLAVLGPWNSSDVLWDMQCTPGYQGPLCGGAFRYLQRPPCLGDETLSSEFHCCT